MTHTDPTAVRSEPDAPSGVLTLPGGRVLAWDEHGDPRGPAIFLFHGAPGCRLIPERTVAAAEELGVRVISPDRPGYGGSTFDPSRTIGSWAVDVASIADQLGIRHFTVVGSSGGGPYALACAATLQDRVAAAYVLCGVGPLDSVEARSSLNPINRPIFEAAALGPSAAVPILDAMAGKTDGADLGFSLEVMMAAMPAEDHAAMASDPSVGKWMGDMMVLLSQGDSLGPAHDLWLYTQRWDFDLASIDVPVYLHAGAHDVNVPQEHLEFQHRGIAGSSLTVWPDDGHMAGVVRMPEVLRQIARDGTESNFA